jgi:hypothetical protein
MLGGGQLWYEPHQDGDLALLISAHPPGQRDDFGALRPAAG